MADWLPDEWEVEIAPGKDGSKSECYSNKETGQTFLSTEALLRYMNYLRNDQPNVPNFKKHFMDASGSMFVERPWEKDTKHSMHDYIHGRVGKCKGMVPESSFAAATNAETRENLEQEIKGGPGCSIEVQTNEFEKVDTQFALVEGLKKKKGKGLKKKKGLQIKGSRRLKPWCEKAIKRKKSVVSQSTHLDEHIDHNATTAFVHDSFMKQQTDDEIPYIPQMMSSEVNCQPVPSSSQASYDPQTSQVRLQFYPEKRVVLQSTHLDEHIDHNATAAFVHDSFMKQQTDDEIPYIPQMMSSEVNYQPVPSSSQASYDPQTSQVMPIDLASHSSWYSFLDDDSFLDLLGFSGDPKDN